MGVNKRKLVLSHKDVKIYHSWKGAQPQTYWYALTPGYNCEGEDARGDFDIRNLPAKYRDGQTVELDFSQISADLDPAEAQQRSRQVFDAVEAAHREILRRAIDDGHDFQRSIDQDHPRRAENVLTRFLDWLTDQELKRRAAKFEKAKAAARR